MSREWVKLHTSMLLHADTQSLDGDAFKAWVNILLLAGTVDDGGRIGSHRDTAYSLHIPQDELSRVVDALDGRVVTRDGQLYVRDWHDWQVRSDRERKADERSRKVRAAAGQAVRGHDGSPPVTAGHDASRDVTGGHKKSRLRREEIRKEPPLPPTPVPEPGEPARSRRLRATGGERPEAARQPAWAPFCAKVSQSLGGVRVVDRRSGQPLAWMGELCGLAGRHAAGDVDVACRLWDAYATSPKWRYRPSRTIDLPAHFGGWCADNPAAVKAAAAVPPDPADIDDRAIFYGDGGVVCLKPIYVVAGEQQLDDVDTFNESTWPEWYIRTAAVLGVD